MANVKKAALMGNQNCGKTTLFNQLTGSNQHVGNFPGVTVEGKEGVVRGHDDLIVVDLPGIYSLSPYTAEEIVARDFVLEQQPAAIINIVDATNLERNLYLTLQLMELGRPMVIALNMMDEVQASGTSIDIPGLEKELGVHILPISASKNEGIEDLINAVLDAVNNGTRRAYIRTRLLTSATRAGRANWLRTHPRRATTAGCSAWKNLATRDCYLRTATTLCLN